MATPYKTPGVYIEEVATLPPSVVPVETAIPAFLGYTENTQSQGQALLHRPVAVDSLLEFQQVFGGPPVLGGFTVTLDADGLVVDGVSDPNAGPSARFRLAHALRTYFDNGGGRCYIVSLGDYAAPGTTAEVVSSHDAALGALAKEDEPTLIVLPDLSSIAPTDPEDADQVAAARASYHGVLSRALNQCADLGDRFLICDLWDGDAEGPGAVDAFRNGIGTRNLRYGAAYHPSLHTTLGWTYDEDTVTIAQTARRGDDGTVTRPSPLDGLTLAALRTGPDADTQAYGAVRAALDRYGVTLPPAAAVAGVFATVDRTRGVWKAPANESLSSVRSPAVEVDQDLNDHMNVHPTGKSVNALRTFAGKGLLVWGGRTLAGNDNEWRYVSVRRFFNFAEESIRNATEAFVFEPNDARTWTKVKALIESFLTLQWRQGALAGAKPEDAFYVRVGLGSTMGPQDVLEGRMIVEIGMAVVRPAEFIVLRFSHLLQGS
ncbi:MAG: phage tail sheath C-terminal domain-containing protein [Acidobacteriota bacterium]